MLIKDILTINKNSINPQKYQEDVFCHFSLPAFDNGKTPEVQFGKEILSSKFKINKPCILFNKLNVRFKRIWNLSKIESNYICSSEYLPLCVINKNFIQEYIYYFLISDTVNSKLLPDTNGTSSSHQRIDPQTLLNIEVMPKPLKEQQHIVNILGSIDEKIENNSNLINKYNYLMGCNILANSKMDTVQLKEMCSIITKGTTPTTLGKKFVSTGINFIKAESILENHIIDDNKISFIDDDTHELLKRSQMQEYDILLSIAGTIGRFSFISKDYIPANTNQAVSIIRPNSIMEFIHIYSYFCSEKQNLYFNEQTVQGVQANISLATVGNTPIPLLTSNNIPEENLLIFNKLILAVNENKKLNELKQLYLKKFFG